MMSAVLSAGMYQSVAPLPLTIAASLNSHEVPRGPR
jgi:hypothetical protein